MEEELKIANGRYAREQLLLDIRRGLGQRTHPSVQQAAVAHAGWFAEHETGEQEIFDAKRREVVREFYRLNPAGWPDPSKLPPFMRFRPIWPVGPTFCPTGSAIVHFLVDAKYSEVLVQVTNIATDKSFEVSDSCQVLAADGMVEVFVRIAFPGNGKYLVKPFGSAHDAETLTPLIYLATGGHSWRFDVEGAPSKDRCSLVSLLAGRITGKLPLPAGFIVDPSDSCVKLRGLDYAFTCKCGPQYRECSLKILGRAVDPAPSRVFAAHDMTARAPSAGMAVVDGKVTCPGEGVWQVHFILGKTVITQYLMTGSTSPVDPTPEEAAAIESKAL
jgi:hypothetical protein